MEIWFILTSLYGFDNLLHFCAQVGREIHLIEDLGIAHKFGLAHSLCRPLDRLRRVTLGPILGGPLAAEDLSLTGKVEL